MYCLTGQTTCPVWSAALHSPACAWAGATCKWLSTRRLRWWITKWSESAPGCHTFATRPLSVRRRAVGFFQTSRAGPGGDINGGICQNHNNGMAWKLADSVRAFFIDDPGRREVAYQLAGKPLLLWWLGACCCACPPPPSTHD